MQNEVVKSGSLEESDGLFSDHTLQWADFSIKRLLACNKVVPIDRNAHEFLLVNAKKRHAFQDKLGEQHVHHEVEEKIMALEEAFRSLDDLDGHDFHRLVDKYQTLDKVLSEAMKCAANHVKDLDKDYQFLPFLIKCSNMVKLSQEVLARTRVRRLFIPLILKFAENVGVKLHARQRFSLRTVRQKLSKAAAKKREAQKDDANNRVKWLEEIAQEAALDHPNTEWQTILSRMVKAAKMKQLNMKLSGVFRRGRSGLDYIEVPDDTWFHDQDSDEVFEIKDGLFCAHSCIQTSTN